MNTPIKVATLPNSAIGNDSNDYRNDPEFINNIQPKPIPNGLDTFVLNGASDAMKAKMLEDKYILGRMAILGQSTVFYGPPSSGKTLLTIWLLIEAIKSGLNPKDVYYINADDNFKGLTYKLSIAEKYGFNMLSPGHNGFERRMLIESMNEMVRADTARGKIIIMDTLKKFTEIMDKRIASIFGEANRQFVSKGGSSILLAHVNKHKNSEGKSVYSGTSDIADDSDCCYTMDVIETTPESKVIEFTNFKDRGDVVRKALFTYSNREDVIYGDLLDSVVELEDSESTRISARNIQQEKLDHNHSVIEEIKSSIACGINTKTELIAEVRNATGESKKRVISVLQEHTGKNSNHGQLWTVKTGDKNKHEYQLNNLAFKPYKGGG